MESFETIQQKLLRAITESSDREKIVRLWKFWNGENSDFSVSELISFYDSERPMTDEEVDEYFKEEEVILPPQILEIIKISEKEIAEGKVYTNEEVEQYFDEWLKD